MRYAYNCVRLATGRDLARGRAAAGSQWKRLQQSRAPSAVPVRLDSLRLCALLAEALDRAGVLWVQPEGAHHPVPEHDVLPVVGVGDGVVRVVRSHPEDRHLGARQVQRGYVEAPGSGSGSGSGLSSGSGSGSGSGPGWGWGWGPGWGLGFG